MNYKELEKLNEIIENLKASPNSDENIQFVLNLADNSVKLETLYRLIKNNEVNLQEKNETNNKDIFQKGTKGKGKLSDSKEEFGFEFTKQEMKKMPERIKKIFIANNYIVNYRITNNGYYEARIRRKDLYVEASGRDFETMRKRFMERLAEHYHHPQGDHDNESTKGKKSPQRVLFTEYAKEWLKIKEKTTKSSTFKEYFRSYTVDLEPFLNDKYLDEIKRNDLQNYLFGIINEGKHRKAEKLALMLKCIFDMAVDDFGIASPMKNVVLPSYQTKKGRAFTKDEEERLVRYCKMHNSFEAIDALLVLLYFGLRKSELKTIEIIDGKWLQCETSKERLGQNTVLRKIPFTPMVKKVLPLIDFEKAKNANLNTVSTRLKKLFPNHHPHELRYTFITRCKECGVNPEVVMMWSGHSEDKDVLSSRISRGYTDFSEDFQLKEAEKVFY